MRLSNILRATSLSLVLGVSALAGPPATEAYKIDTVHSTVGFAVRHMTVSTVRGVFGEYSGTIQLDPADLTKSSVDVTIKTASVNTFNANRDTHLKGADFFEVEKFPEITFKSGKIQKRPNNKYGCIGMLTMHGVTKPVEILFTMSGPAAAGKKTVIGIEGSVTINRKDFGLTWNRALDGGGVAVSDEVTITLDVEAFK